jgi:hypothetical protein
MDSNLVKVIFSWPDTRELHKALSTVFAYKISDEDETSEYPGLWLDLSVSVLLRISSRSTGGFGDDGSFHVNPYP